jgi:hypothetical protein
MMYKANSIRACAQVRAPARAPTILALRVPRAVPHKSCEYGEACYALTVRSDRLAKVLSDAIAHAQEIVATASSDGATDYTMELRQAWDAVAEISGAVTRTNARLEGCIAEHDYLNYADADMRLAERKYDL